MSRRSFLRKLGLGVAALPLASRASAGSRPTKNNRPLLKLGVLVPDSPRYPLMADNFLDGLRLSIGSHQAIQTHEIELFIERYQPGRNELKHKATKLAEYHQVDMMTGLVSGHDGFKIKPIVEPREILFLENTLGEVIQSKVPESTCMYSNSLHLWNSAYLSGSWAVKHLGNTCLIATSFYDSGFANVAAFRKGYEEAGGMVLQTHVTNMTDNDDFGALFSDIKQLQPDFVVGHYSGNEAIGFVHSYRHQGVAIPLLGSGLMCSDANLQVQGSSADAIVSMCSWTRTLDNEVNYSFVDNFETTHRRIADVYSVLGFESGQLFRSALSKLSKHPTTDDLIKAFATVTIDSPRGALKMQDQHILSPIYLKKVKQRNGFYLEEVTDQFALLDADHSSIDELRSSIQSGWTNPYMT